jgi:hypothetical protein
MDPQTQGGPFSGQQQFGRQGGDPAERFEPGRGAQGRAPSDRSDVSGAAKESARAIRQSGQDVRRQARHAGEDLGRNFKESVGSIVDRGKSQVAEQVDCAARALHNAAGDLEDSSPQMARLAHNAADQVERATDYLRQDGRQILRDLEDFARREPLMFLGGAIITGVLFGRFIKASNARDYEESNDYGPSRGHEGSREFDTDYERDEGSSRPTWEPRRKNVMPSEGPANFPEPPGNPPMGGGI